MLAVGESSWVLLDTGTLLRPALAGIDTVRLATHGSGPVCVLLCFVVLNRIDLAAYSENIIVGPKSVGVYSFMPIH